MSSQRENAQFRATAGAQQGFGTIPQNAPAALLSHRPGADTSNPHC